MDDLGICPVCRKVVSVIWLAPIGGANSKCRLQFRCSEHRSGRRQCEGSVEVPLALCSSRRDTAGNEYSVTIYNTPGRTLGMHTVRALTALEAFARIADRYPTARSGNVKEAHCGDTAKFQRAKDGDRCIVPSFEETLRRMKVEQEMRELLEREKDSI